uniref:Uncharacterized protein n=1 Tax=Otus sunia TaxID=257818 RepID=A0A8C8E7P5_9STRI
MAAFSSAEVGHLSSTSACLLKPWGRLLFLRLLPSIKSGWCWIMEAARATGSFGIWAKAAQEEDRVGYDPQNPFIWESRLPGTKPGNGPSLPRAAHCQPRCSHALSLPLAPGMSREEDQFSFHPTISTPYLFMLGSTTTEESKRERQRDNETKKKRKRSKRY